jgi:hypothetical protein
MSGFSFAALQATAKESGFTVLDAATYRMRITKSEAKKSKNTGKDMIVVTLKVVAGPMKDKGTVINNFVVSPESPAALHFFFLHMAAFGLDEAYFAQPGLSMEQTAKDLLNREAMVELTIGQYNGNDKNEVGKITKVTDGPQAAPAMNGGPGVPNITSPVSVSNGTPSSIPTITPPPPAVAQPAVVQDTDNGNNGQPEPAMAGATAASGPAMPKAPF